MKTKTFFLLCLFLGIGLTKLSAQPAIGKSGNYYYRDIFYDFCEKVPINCNINTTDFLVGTVKVHFVAHYSKYDGNDTNWDWCRMQFHGEFVLQATGEVFKVNDIFTMIGPYTQPATGHFNAIGNQGSHYIVDYLWDNWSDGSDITIVGVKCPGQ
jgi:hypothetical protein